MSLTTPEAIRRLQRKLYVKAKVEPTRRFHQLYDKVYRADMGIWGHHTQFGTEISKVSPQFPPFLGTPYSTRGNSPEFYHPPSFPLPVARSSAILFLQRYTPRETVTKWFDYQAG